MAGKKPHALAPFIDHSCLRPNLKPADVDKACAEALAYGFRGVVVPGVAVGHAKKRVGDAGPKVVAVVAFPHGTSAIEVKAFEAMSAVAAGADEVDYVVSIGEFLSSTWRSIAPWTAG